MAHSRNIIILLISILSIIILTATDSSQTRLTASTLQSDSTFTEVNLNSTTISPEVRFIYNGTFKLTTGQTEVIVPSLISTGEITLDPHTELHLDVAKSSSSSSTLLVSIVWPTNKIGSTLEQWLYNYEASGKLTLLWSLMDERLSVESSQVNEHTLELNLPDYRLNQHFQVKEDDLKRLLSTSSLPNPLAQSDLIDIGPPIAYNISESTIDHTDKWVVKRLIFLQAPPFSVGYLYTQFRIQDNNVVVDKAFISSFADPIETDISGLSF